MLLQRHGTRRVVVGLRNAVGTNAPGDGPGAGLNEDAWGAVFESGIDKLSQRIKPTTAYDAEDLRPMHDSETLQHDGAEAYQDKCRELGIAPLSSVMAGLDQWHANLSHCRLSSKGAHALAHALACNVMIRHLTLADNQISGKASSMPPLLLCCQAICATHAHSCGLWVIIMLCMRMMQRGRASSIAAATCWCAKSDDRLSCYSASHIKP